MPAFEVTDEIVGYAVEIVDGWYQAGRIDWEDVWDRLDGTELVDGTRLDLGTDLASLELVALKAAVRKVRRG
ncbi:hypothetical protein [Nonomuraea longicatena]|uniref:Uncharacterized protein n=1 Tax=Nonomuraea longicatena TaxID=83682 RepID=A0ABP4BVP6_9ACTN